MNQEDLETISLTIIHLSDRAQNKAFEAIRLAKKEEKDKARFLLEEARGILKEAKSLEESILIEEINGNWNSITALYLRAQGRSMNCDLALKLIEELIDWK